jgi:hypothetical protein
MCTPTPALQTLWNRQVVQLFLVNDQLDAQIPFYVFIFIFNSLHVSSTSCSSSVETNCVNTTSVNCHSVLMAVSCAHNTVNNTEWQLSEIVLTKFVSPDDEHDVLKTCRVKNKYKERNLSIKLVIYQESLHDAWSTKYKSCPVSPCVRISVWFCLTKCWLPFHVRIYVEQQQ